MQERASEINIGMIGHVDHGKTTLVHALSGIWTDTHSEELKRGITIRLGYADVSIYRCPNCQEPEAYTTKTLCPKCGAKTAFLRKISLVDAPGHESLMATMLSGAALMDGALLIIAANEPCPQPQTREHVKALEICQVKHIVVVQNKIDLVSEADAEKNYNQIREFLKETPYKDAPVIPISAQRAVNIDALLQAIQENIPTPQRDPKANPLLLVARSFDINKPGTKPEELVGGVLGGTLKQGILKIGDEIEILPGYSVETQGVKKWIKLKTKIIGLKSGGIAVKEIKPGGSVGVLTSLDPSITRGDSLGGSVAGIPGKLPPVLHSITLDVNLLERVVGAKEELKVEPLKINEPLMLNVNAAATVGIVTEIKDSEVKCILKLPVCAETGSRVTLSRRIGNRFRLIGYGIIK